MSSPAGYVTDLYGSRVAILVGCIFTSSGYYTASISNALWSTMLTLGFLVGTGGSFVYTGSFTIVGQWFDKNRGLAMGIANSGAGYGQFILVQTMSSLLDSVGLKGTLQYMALIELTGCLLCLVICVPNPELYSVETKSDNIIQLSQVVVTENLDIENASLHRDQEAQTVEKKKKEDTFESKKLGSSYISTLKELFKNRCFLSLFVALFTVSFVDMFPLAYVPSYAMSLGFSAIASNNLVSYMGLGSGTGRLVCGILADRFNKFLIFRISLLVCGIITFGWLGYESYGTLVFYSVFFGFCLGSCMALFGPICFELFGAEMVGTAIGLVLASSTLGDLVSLPIGATLLLYSGYDAIIIVCASVYLLSFLCFDYAADVMDFVVSSSVYLYSLVSGVKTRIDYVRHSLSNSIEVKISATPIENTLNSLE